MLFAHCDQAAVLVAGRAIQAVSIVRYEEEWLRPGYASIIAHKDDIRLQVGDGAHNAVEVKEERF